MTEESDQTSSARRGTASARSFRFAAFVITYERPAILARTLEKLVSQTVSPEYLLVVDNGSGMAAKEVAARFANHGVAYHSMGTNTGPAGAAAFALRTLCEAGWEAIYWGDDDDPPLTDDTLERLLALAASADRENLGAVGRNGTRWNWRRGVYVRLSDEELQGIVDVDSIAGNSQLIIMTNAVASVGLPAPQLGFGYEELEFCLRLRKAGLRLLVDGDFFMEHRRLVDRLNYRKPVSAMPKESANTMWRGYYGTRNYIHMMRRTFNQPRLAHKLAMKAMIRSALSFTRGFGFGVKYTRYQLRGIRDGYAGRLGMTVLPERKYSSQPASEGT